MVQKKIGFATDPDSERTAKWQCAECGNQNPAEHTSCLNCGASASSAADQPVQIGAVTFDPTGYQTLQFSPLWVFGLVAGADGKVDMKEFGALLGTLVSSQFTENRLVREVFGSVFRNFEAIWSKYIEDDRGVDTAFKDVRQVLDATVEPQEARQFKLSLLRLADQVAEASGGVLGLGSKVSDSEKAAFVAAAVSLGLTPDELKQSS